MTHVNTLGKNCPNLLNLWLKSNFFQVSRGCREDLPEDMPMKHGFFKKLEILFFKVGEGELALNFVPPYVFHYIVRNTPRLKELTIALRHSALKLEKKVHFQKCKKALFAFSKMAKNQFLHQKKV